MNKCSRNLNLFPTRVRCTGLILRLKLKLTKLLKTRELPPCGKDRRKTSADDTLTIVMVDESTRKTLSSIPLLKTRAGPRDKELWVQRLKEEYQALIKYVQNNKSCDNDWFRLESNKEGTRWFGKCWFIHNLLKYEFDVEFDVPVTYPTAAPEIALPELDGKTAKMYRGGKICLTDHFKPLWARNVPKFGIAQAMALGLGPWLAVEVPDLIEKGVITYQEKNT